MLFLYTLLIRCIVERKKKTWMENYVHKSSMVCSKYVGKRAHIYIHTYSTYAVLERFVEWNMEIGAQIYGELVSTLYTYTFYINYNITYLYYLYIIHIVL